jgi:hypothetical protein
VYASTVYCYKKNERVNGDILKFTRKTTVLDPNQPSLRNNYGSGYSYPNHSLYYANSKASSALDQVYVDEYGNPISSPFAKKGLGMVNMYPDASSSYHSHSHTYNQSGSLHDAASEVRVDQFSSESSDLENPNRRKNSVDSNTSQISLEAKPKPTMAVQDVKFDTAIPDTRGPGAKVEPHTIQSAQQLKGISTPEKVELSLPIFYNDDDESHSGKSLPKTPIRSADANTSLMEIPNTEVEKNDLEMALKQESPHFKLPDINPSKPLISDLAVSPPEHVQLPVAKNIDNDCLSNTVSAATQEQSDAGNGITEHFKLPDLTLAKPLISDLPIANAQVERNILAPRDEEIRPCSSLKPSIDSGNQSVSESPRDQLDGLLMEGEDPISERVENLDISVSPLKETIEPLSLMSPDIAIEKDGEDKEDGIQLDESKEPTESSLFTYFTSAIYNPFVTSNENNEEPMIDASNPSGDAESIKAGVDGPKEVTTDDEMTKGEIDQKFPENSSQVLPAPNPEIELSAISESHEISESKQETQSNVMEPKAVNPEE